MIKNRITQIIFQTVYCVLALIGVLGSFGYFEARFSSNFYIYYTNLSNYICFGVIFVSLINTIKQANKKEDGYCTTVPTFNFMCVILIMVTFFVYNILLAKEKTPFEYFTSISNLLLHVILPIMFVIHWILFYEHNKVKWYWPLLCVVMPLIYVIFILIRAAIIGSKTNSFLYPYFFLDVKTLGWGGFFTWIAILLVVFVALGYLLYALDNIRKIKTKFKKNK